MIPIIDKILFVLPSSEMPKTDWYDTVHPSVFSDDTF